jgi:hypothetical protein
VGATATGTAPIALVGNGRATAGLRAEAVGEIRLTGAGTAVLPRPPRRPPPAQRARARADEEMLAVWLALDTLMEDAA